jgi:hypothetical protein
LVEKSLLQIASSDLTVACKQTWLSTKHNTGGDVNAISSMVVAVAVEDISS